MPEVTRRPWCDLKVALPVDDETGPEVFEDIWKAFGPGCAPGNGLPEGWSLCGTDAGFTSIAIFRVEGDLHVQDGKHVEALIQEIVNQCKVAAPAP